MRIQRALSLDASPEALDKVICAGRGVRAFTATPDALVGVDLDEQAVATSDVTTLDIGNLQIRRARRFASAVYGLCENGKRL